MEKKIKKIVAIALAVILIAAIPVAVPASALGNSITFSVSLTAESDRIAAMAQPKDNGLCLAKDGETDYVLVYSAAAGARLKYAVEFFAETFEKMTGAKLEVRTDDAMVTEKEIVIGDTTRASVAPTSEEAGADGYRVLTDGAKLYLCGVNELGSMNAVYGFLEDELGCLWATEKEDYIPNQPTVYIGGYNTVEKPAMAWRNVYAYETSQPNWFEKLRLNGIGYYQNSDEINQYNQWGTWCHSVQTFVPESEYFEFHPEYFAMVDGERKPSADGKSAQLCLSNPDVLKIAKAKLNELIEENPEQIYWDFSIMDNKNQCTCDACAKLDKAAGGTGMGTLLPFLNELAKDHPDKYISTLAYFYTTDAPKNITAEPNVVIKLCAMTGDQACSYKAGTSQGSYAFKKALKSWKKVTSNIIVWDYVVNFNHLLLPFPNFAVQKDNQEFYEESNVMGVFHQASREVGGEFANLRAYLLAKLMWEGSNMDVSAVVSRYLEIYYGDAAPYIANYMNKCASALSISAQDLGLYDSPYTHRLGYLSSCNITYYRDCFTKAEEAVKDNDIYLSRVKQAKIPILYAKINEDSNDEDGRQIAAEEFFELCDRYGITQWGEVNSSIEDYRNGGMDKAIEELHEKQKKEAIALGVVGGVIGTVIILCKLFW